MKLRCPGCHAVLSLADDKIPAGKEFKILCPRCRTPIEQTNAEAAEEPATLVTETALENREDSISALDLLDEKTPLSLLYISQAPVAEKVETSLREAGFHVTAAASVQQGLAVLSQHACRVVVTEELPSRQEGASHSDFLTALRALPMATRRQFLLCLVSESVPTLDRLGAFAAGVDLIINVQDLENGTILLRRALQERAGLYTVFSEELERQDSF